MLSLCLESLGLILSVSGSLLVMIACGLPMWKVTAFIDANIVVAQSVWDGLWMSCVVQSTGQMQCRSHHSVLALSRDLQTARALSVLSSVLGVVGVAVCVTGARCTVCVKSVKVKARVVSAGGLCLLLGGVSVLVPLGWICKNIVQDFHDPQVPVSTKREIGASIYVGWGGAGLMLLGGALLCGSASGRLRGTHGKQINTSYNNNKTVCANGDFDKKLYV